GAKEREIQLVLDEEALKQYGINTQEVMQSISNANKSSSVGTIEKGTQDLQVRVTGEFRSLEEIRQTIVQSESGATVHVEDIAEVHDTFKKNDSTTLVNGDPSIVLSMMKKTDANTVDVAKNIKAGLEEINASLPEGAELDVVIDTS